MFHNLTQKLALVAVTATVGLAALTSPAHAVPPRPQSIPEPASMLGLLAVSAVSTVSFIKRNKKQKV